MFLELHILQNFAPSNLNRDDTGSPKTAEFGGYRRARISSQAIKRAIRRDPSFTDALHGHGAVRTRRLLVEIASRLAGEHSQADVLKAVAELFKAAGLDRAGRRDDEENTSILLYMRESAIQQMADSIRPHLASLLSRRSEGRDALIQELAEVLEASARCPDVALFGRMLEVGDATPFGRRNLRVDGATQFSHAISTHRVSVEFDYYTAVDDLNPTGVTGAGMIGTVEFNSACYYRYANVDLGQLKANLDDAGLAASTVRAFLIASRDAIPTGKQNSFAARNAPSFIFAAVRNGTCWSLANAFVNPIRAREDKDLVAGSIEALDTHWGELVRLYGAPTDATLAVCKLGDAQLTNLGSHEVATFDALVEKTLGAVQPALAS